MLVDRFGEVTILELDKMGTEIHSIVPEVEFIIAEKNFNRVLKARKISKEMEKKLESGKVNVKDFLNPNSTVEKGDLLKPTATQPRTIVSAILNRRKP
jgi:hypothetical protein